jgi:hypothetical protein
MSKNQTPALTRDWRHVLQQVVVKKCEVVKAPTTPTPTRIVGKTGKQLWTDYCLLVTPLKGEAK